MEIVGTDVIKKIKSYAKDRQPDFRKRALIQTGFDLHWIYRHSSMNQSLHRTSV